MTVYVCSHSVQVKPKYPLRNLRTAGIMKWPSTCDGWTGPAQPNSNQWKQTSGTSFKKENVPVETSLHQGLLELLQPVTLALLGLGTERRKYIHKNELILDNESSMWDCFPAPTLGCWPPPLALSPFEGFLTTLCMAGFAFLALIFTCCSTP